MQTTTAQASKTSQQICQSGRWVTERTYAEIHGLAKATLANWRFRDGRAGRNEAAPGYPRYRRFGRAVRYWLPADSSEAA